MGYFYKLTWPTSPDVVSVAVTGSFDNWSLSQKNQLRKAVESASFETTVYVDQKQKLVFKFVVNDSIWTTYESYKKEFDENGNENNYVDADELIDENQLSSSEGSSIDPVPKENESPEEGPEAVSDLKAHDKEEGFNEAQEQPFLPSAGGDHDISESCDSVKDTKPLSSYSQTTLPYVSLVEVTSSSEDLCKDSKEPTELSIKQVDINMLNDFCSESTHATCVLSADYGSHPETCSLTESSFTEVSFVTSSSQYALQDLEHVSEQDRSSYFRQMSPNISQDYEPQEETGTAESSNLNTLVNKFVSPPHLDCIHASDYASDDEIDSLDDAPHLVDTSAVDTQPGVFAKIRGLFRF